MTDTVQFFRTVIAQTNAFLKAYEDLLLVADRLTADSSLAGLAAASANANGRADLSTADFDNFKNAVAVIQNKMNTNDPSVNAATVKLPFYKLI